MSFSLSDIKKMAEKNINPNISRESLRYNHELDIEIQKLLREHGIKDFKTEENTFNRSIDTMR